MVFNLNLKDVKYKAGEIPFPIDDFDLSMRILWNDIEIDNLELISGGSDLKIKGSINEVYQFIDYTNQTVTANLDFSSKNLDLYELTGKKDSSMNKEISHLKMNFSFKAKAKSLIESKGFPEGEFSIKELNAEIKNYLHTLSDFSADQSILEKEQRIIIQQIMNGLPSKCKQVFAMSRIDQLSNKEIASLLDISIKTVEDKITKALKIFRKKLNNE